MRGFTPGEWDLGDVIAARTSQNFFRVCLCYNPTGRLAQIVVYFFPHEVGGGQANGDVDKATTAFSPHGTRIVDLPPFLQRFPQSTPLFGFIRKADNLHAGMRYAEK